ncbi:uncharacterized protein BDR25DRAFT_102316 [Lindgomyces ingoldianus]|uniref:Uncharacterized protein n=1 Tax=Lindgomyces ingoldianus TaxID=673940 RepID=A0ACB6R8H8_9PLEO|nr:uncharacterized protein BDR25DRAFT_102316 [Lindgomyces ingoldianus]KAF2475397.1 hypothetical protein BDR25DRAFT_102316 [Lindgomyces ingoldianus]
MVVIVDLGDDSSAHASNASGFPSVKPLHHSLATISRDTTQYPGAEANRPNPNINGFSAALSCYPIVRQLASQLDLNTLHDLSRTCRQFRANLLEYRDQLIKHTLHCANEDPGVGIRLVQGLRQSLETWEQETQLPRQLTSGRVGKCARDMVGECQRCGTVVCRNCTIKPPPTPTLRVRHRRLCRTCTKAPLHLLTAPKRIRTMSSSSPPLSPRPAPTLFDDQPTPAFTASAFDRAPCCCDTMVWLCQPCGQNLRSADTMYIRAWTWRTRYSHYLGGVGTGAGEGNEGVNCGRGPECLAAKTVEHEMDCDAETLAMIESKTSEDGRWKGTSYHAQEIEGVGGVVKMKAKKQVRVGNCVKVYEDERDRSIQYLPREVQGKLRSWCSWCQRVVLSGKDLEEEIFGVRPPSSVCSSESSGR